MTTWVFDGTVLPEGESTRLTFSTGSADGPGEQLPGRYGVPGLVDAHAHLTVKFHPTGPTMHGAELAAERLEEAARAGITAVRDAGGNREITLRLARTNDGTRPYVLAAGRFFAPAGRYFPTMHDTPVAPEDLLQAVEREIEDGATWLKLIGDFPDLTGDNGGKLGPTYDLDHVNAMVDFAHSRGVRVATHVTGDRVSDLVAAGVDSVEHGWALTDQDLRTLAANNAAWTPTMCASLDYAPNDNPERAAARQARSEYFAEMLQRAVRYGVRILAGTDVVGSLPREIELLVRHGLTADEAIAAASTGAHEFLGLRSTGNLATYEADPREHPDVLAKPAAVVLNHRRIG